MSSPEFDKWLGDNFGESPAIAKAAAIDGYEFAMRNSGWRCVKTDPPKPTVPVIACRLRRGGKSVSPPVICSMRAGCKVWDDDRGLPISKRIGCGLYVDVQMTHWMPVPDTSMLMKER